MSLNRYRYSRRIAVGGMAEVLLARQQGLGGFEKLVVVKRILPHIKGDGAFVDMFLNEARLAASLRHPNIIEIYDVYREADEFAIVMEYLSGETVRLLLSEARRHRFPIPIGIASRVAASAAAALAHAHDAPGSDGWPQGIVHRDVAPNNIIVTYDGAVKLLDFGIAKANVHNVYTQPGALKGKYSYCSPEQVRRKPLDHRSDIFSLGIVLHEMLTRRKLFGGATPADQLKAVMEKSIVPPSQLNPEVPPELDAVVLGALERSVENRTPTAAKLRDDLEGIIQQYKMAVSPSHISRWMNETFAENKRQRQLVEQEVAAEGQGTRTDVGRLPVAGFRGASTRDLSLPSNYSSVGHAPPLSGSHAGSVSIGPLTPQERSPMARLMITSSVVTLLIVLLLGAAFWFGRQTNLGSPATVVPTGTTEIARDELELPDSVALHLHVVPTDARVTVDGERIPNRIGKDGILIPAPPKTGVLLEVEKKGYRPHVVQVESPSRGTKNVYVTLFASRDAPPVAPPAPTPEEEVEEEAPPPPTRASRSRRAPVSDRIRPPVVTVQFEPPDAKLYLGRQRIPGRSPITIDDLEPGRYVLRAVRDGYEDDEASVTIDEGDRRTVNLRLRRLPQLARVDVITSPNGADVTIDGKPRGRAPLVGLKLKPGSTHSIQVNLRGFEPWSTRIRLDEGTNPPIVATLNRIARPAPPPTPAATTRQVTPSDILVPGDRVGNAENGLTLYRSKCGKCHGPSAPVVRASRYSQAQWSRYFATARHQRHSKLGDEFTVGQLADVKAYLQENAVDGVRVRAAGVR